MFNWETIKQELHELRAAWKSAVPIGALLILGTWLFAREHYSERMAAMDERMKLAEARLATPAAKAESTPSGALAQLPTSLRLAFSGGPVPSPRGGENLNRWYTLTDVNEQASGERTNVRTILFWTFQQPIPDRSASIELTVEGAATPLYEVKDFSPRSAIVVIHKVPAGVLVLRVRYAQ